MAMTCLRMPCSKAAQNTEFRAASLAFVSASTGFNLESMRQKCAISPRYYDCRTEAEGVDHEPLFRGSGDRDDDVKGGFRVGHHMDGDLLTENVL